MNKYEVLLFFQFANFYNFMIIQSYFTDLRHCLSSSCKNAKFIYISKNKRNHDLRSRSKFQILINLALF